MSKIATITRITSRVLDKYRNSIPRKAFIDAMEQVAAEAITSGEKQLGGSGPRHRDPEAPRRHCRRARRSDLRRLPSFPQRLQRGAL